MFSSREATTVAVRALREHIDPGVAEEFRGKFERYSSDLVPPPRDVIPDEFDTYDRARATRLLHVESTMVLEALGQAAYAGDRTASDLLVDITENRDGRSSSRMAALSILARYFPAPAGELALVLLKDDQVSHLIGEALTRSTRSPDLAPALERIASDSRYDVHMAAMESLAKLGEPGSQALARLLRSSDVDVRGNAGGTITRHELATPSVVEAIDRYARRFPDGPIRAVELLKVAQGPGFSLTLRDAVTETLAGIDRMDRVQRPPEREAKSWDILRRFGWKAKAEPTAPEPPEPNKGILDRHREVSGCPLGPVAHLGESLAKVCFLRPEIMRELERASAHDSVPADARGSRRLDRFEMWYGEERDGYVVVPIIKQLVESPGFRQRVRSIVAALQD
jgi:hypothetical protein